MNYVGSGTWLVYLSANNQGILKFIVPMDIRFYGFEVILTYTNTFNFFAKYSNTTLNWICLIGIYLE